MEDVCLFFKKERCDVGVVSCGLDVYVVFLCFVWCFYFLESFNDNDLIICYGEVILIFFNSI